MLKWLFFTTLLFLPTQLGKHFWPEFSLISGLRVDYLSPTIYLTDIFIISVLVWWGVKELTLNGKKKLFPPWEYPILLGFAAVILAGIALSNNPYAGLFGMMKLIEFSLFGIFIARGSNMHRYLTPIIAIFSIGVCFESLLALAQFLKQGSVSNTFWILGERSFTGQTPGIANTLLDGQLILRPYATFAHPNVLAGYLTIAMTIIISSIKNRASNIKRPLLYFAVTIGTAALIVTMSRVAIVIWIIVLIINIFPLIFNFRKFFNEKSKLLLLAPVITVILFIPFLAGRFTSLSIDQESFTLRENLINISTAMIKEHPILGVGLHNFLPNISEYQQQRNISPFLQLQPVHNIYLLIAAETGILGLLFFLWFIIKTFRKIPLRISSLPFQILTAVLLLGFFDHYFLTLQQGQMLFTLVLGLCWASRK